MKPVLPAPTIRLKDALSLLDGPAPVPVRWVTYDRRRHTGGAFRDLAAAHIGSGKRAAAARKPRRPAPTWRPTARGGAHRRPQGPGPLAQRHPQPGGYGHRQAHQSPHLPAYARRGVQNLPLVQQLVYAANGLAYHRGLGAAIRLNVALGAAASGKVAPGAPISGASSKSTRSRFRARATPSTSSLPGTPSASRASSMWLPLLPGQA